MKGTNKNKDQILATVSHELRTPLHGIIGLLDISETKVRDPEVLGHLSLCKDNAHLLSSLVNSLLDLQQLSTGKLKLNKSKIDIVKTVKNVIQLFKFQSDQKNISFELEVQKDINPWVFTDENRFRQVLINLIGNAIKFTFKGGVKVMIEQDPEEWERFVISVQDTGIGIKQEDIGKLFKLYGKLADSSNVNKHGVGLGLTISNTLASLLKGHTSQKGIEVTSEYGVGSKFSFKILKSLRFLSSVKTEQFLGTNEIKKERRFESLAIGRIQTESEISEDGIADENSQELTSPFPLSSKLSSYIWRTKETQQNIEIRSKFGTCEEIPSVKGEKRKSEVRPRTESFLQTTSNMKKSKGIAFANECVLVVDDNPFNILVAKSLLQDIGYEVKSASGGHEAIDIVRLCFEQGKKIRVIFMDCQMPVMDGYETTKTLKGMMDKGEVPKVPILAWTANNGEQDIKRCYESGMTGYLSKPTTKENVIKAVPK